VAGQFVVYEFRTTDGALYIGVTRDWPTRLIAHRSSSPWYNEATAIHLRRFKTTSEAATCEAALISELMPRYNRDTGGIRSRAWEKQSDESPVKSPRHFRLSAEARRLLDALQAKLGLSHSGLIEMAIRKFAEQENVA
jgi:predicted GIY-YIG superfamily endonuclease